MEKYNLDDKGGIFRLLTKSPLKLIKSGDSIDFKHFNQQAFAKASVTDVNESEIKIQAKEKLLPAGIAIAQNDHVLLHSSSGDILVVTGEIASVAKNDPFEATIRVAKIEKLKDLVKEKKCCVSFPAAFKIIGISEARPAEVKMMSLGGIRANCREDVMLEDIIEVTIYVDKLNKMNIKGRVVRKGPCAGGTEYGIEYTEVPESSMKILAHTMYQFETMV